MNLKRFGPKARRAIPTLLKRLGSQDHKAVSAALGLLRYTGLTRASSLRSFSRLLFGKRRRLRIEALDTLRAMGAHAAPALRLVRRALPLSAKGFYGQEGELTCAKILRHVGKGAMGPLIRLLRHPKAYIRDEAVAGLIHIDRKLRYKRSVKRKIIHLLIRQLLSSDADRKKAAVQQLQYVKPKRGPLLDAIHSELSDGRSGIAASLFWLLGEIKARASISIVMEYVADRNVDSYAISALGAMGTRAAKAIPLLLKQLKRREVSFWIKQRVLSALVRIDPRGTSIYPALLGVMKDKDSSIRKTAIKALGRIRSKPASSIPHLIRGLQDKSADVRLAALRALGRARRKPAAVVPHLVRALFDGESIQVVEGAASALGAYGAKARVAVPGLLLLLDRRSQALRNVALGALAKIGKRRQLRRFFRWARRELVAKVRAR